MVIPAYNEVCSSWLRALLSDVKVLSFQAKRIDHMLVPAFEFLTKWSKDNNLTYEVIVVTESNMMRAVMDCGIFWEDNSRRRQEHG